MIEIYPLWTWKSRFLVKAEQVILVKKLQEFPKDFQKTGQKCGVELSFLLKKDDTCIAEISW